MRSCLLPLGAGVCASFDARDDRVRKCGTGRHLGQKAYLLGRHLLSQDPAPITNTVVESRSYDDSAHTPL